MLPQSTIPWADLTAQTLAEISSADQLSKLIIDLRQNTRNSISSEFNMCVEQLKACSIKDIYVLIDGKTNHAAVLGAAQLKRELANVMLVGSPAAHAPNFLANPVITSLPFSGLQVAVASSYYEGWPGFAGDTLRPDMEIWQTLEDYINAVDTVLAAIRSY